MTFDYLTNPFFRHHWQTLSSAPTASNILLFGDMEGDPRSILNQWPGRCTVNVINKADGPVYEGDQSLYHEGGKNCLLFRPIAAGCYPSRMGGKIQAGDTLYISAKVRAKAPNRLFEMYTRHYHKTKGKRRWGLPPDDSYLISRTLIKNANEWTAIEAAHVVGDDWKWKGEMLEPEGCNHFHLRFRIPGKGEVGFYLDDVRVARVPGSLGSVGDDGNNSTERVATRTAEIKVPASGFFANPAFELGLQYWKYAATTGHVRRDPKIGGNVMVMRRGKVLRQNVLPRVIPGEKYQFGFWTSISGVKSVDFRIMMRLRFINEDLENGPCHKPICNYFNRPLAKNVKANGGNWQHVISDEFDFFGNFTEWEKYGKVDFILFQLLTRNLGSTGEFSVANFEVFGEEYTDAPSQSKAPSTSPTNLLEEHLGYIVKYGKHDEEGEVRTVVRQPFQIDKTGEILSMGSNAEYKLCEVDEVEGRKAEASRQWSFEDVFACSFVVSKHNLTAFSNRFFLQAVS